MLIHKISVITLLFVSFSRFEFARPVTFIDNNLYRNSTCVLEDGSEGICITNCSLKLSSKICGYEGDAALICCPKIRQSPRFPTIERVCREQIEHLEKAKLQLDDSVRYLKEINDQYRQEWLEEQRKCAEIPGYQGDCKKSRPTRIEGFTPIHPVMLGEQLHMVALGWSYGIGKGIGLGQINWDCGGSLIHPKVVLTAAHCMENKGRPPDKVYIGGVDFTDGRERWLEGPIEEIFMHPNYTSNQTYNDIALLIVPELTGQDGRKITKIACLWTEKQIPRPKLLAMGFGAPAFGRTNNNKLYQGNLTILETEECSKFYEKTSEMPEGLTDSQICAYDPEGVLDSCEGDSGGPLQFNDETLFKMAHLVGIISFGPPCRSGTPGGYTRIYSFMDWIEETLSRELQKFEKE